MGKKKTKSEKMLMKLYDTVLDIIFLLGIIGGSIIIFKHFGILL